MQTTTEGKVILIVDDSEDDRMFARDALTRVGTGFDIREVHDGLALLEYLRDTGANSPFPDLVLLDLKMPRMSGLEALREIRGDAALRHLPIVAVYTTATETEFVRETYASGANAFVGKPASSRELVEAMRIIVQHWFGVVSLPAPGPSAIPTA